GKITELFVGKLPAHAERIVDAEGLFVSPGFIDIHTHGGGGYEFLDGTPEAYEAAATFHMLHGVTSISPTLSASLDEELFAALSAFKQAKTAMKGGPNLLGLHLEGPYFSYEERGAQDARYLKTPTPEHYLRILNSSDDIIRWSSAPELPGALELADELSRRGIVCAIGHSNATHQQVVPAFERGYTHITHLYSGCSSLRRIHAFRYMGVVDSAFAIDNMTVEIIADGCHLPAELLKLIVKIKPWDKISLISDSMRCAGMPEGSVQYTGTKQNGMEVLIEDGVAKLTDRSAFAGSVATADRLVRNMCRLAEIPLPDAVRMMTYNPACVLRLQSEKGVLAPGRDADICIFDDEINIRAVLVNGEIKKETPP
ncbi:MAG: N-acetylglucosamine-6-phosphate deacetylase, partial [Clostridia bacterium]|nr:N-acetylglucosamine-6-phosphate deacetylase [Clostridia bacterium]